MSSRNQRIAMKQAAETVVTDPVISGWFRFHEVLMDGASFILPVILNSGKGSAVIGEDRQRAEFTINRLGEVNLISATSLIYVNSNTAGKFCIGTSISNPCVVLNRTGVNRFVTFDLFYN